MIVRGYIKCSTCGHPHMPRVQVGIEPSQVHTFNCLNCNEPIKLALNANDGPFKVRIVPLENCEEIEETECTPVYLCADFTAHPEQINERMAMRDSFMQEIFARGKTVYEAQHA